MALHWWPVGREPAETYWQRRAMLVGGLVLALILLAVLVTGGDDPDRLAAGGPSPSPQVSSTPTPTPTPTLSVSAAPATACPPVALQVLAGADKDGYPVGGRPVLELRVTNTGTSSCTVDLGQAAVELLVYSGTDRIWSSDDCAPGGAAKVTTLEPGRPTSSLLTWAGRRSLPGCEGPKAQAQPGTYRVTGRVGQLQVEGDSFRFTG